MQDKFNRVMVAVRASNEASQRACRRFDAYVLIDIGVAIYPAGLCRVGTGLCDFSRKLQVARIRVPAKHAT
jgi:hypothetical protein